MKTFKPITACILFCSLFALAGCEKEGPIGPQGETGTANVIYSDWMHVNFEDRGDYYTGTLNAPKLTQAILDKGEVSVYVKVIGPDIAEYYKLNYVEDSYFAYMFPSIGEIHLSTSFDGGKEMYAFRYVLIPGGVAANAREWGIDFDNYNVVAEVFGIVD